MFSIARQALLTRSLARAFSTTPSRSSDMSKLLLIGRLGKDPEVRMTKNDKEYIFYSVATTNYPPPPPNPDGTRPESKTTWHHIVSFNPHSNNFLRNLQKGSHVFVEANFQMRESDPEADPRTPQGQRQVFLRHENIRVIRGPGQSSENAEEQHAEESS